MLDECNYYGGDCCVINMPQMPMPKMNVQTLTFCKIIGWNWYLWDFPMNHLIVTLSKKQQSEYFVTTVCLQYRLLSFGTWLWELSFLTKFTLETFLGGEVEICVLKSEMDFDHTCLWKVKMKHKFMW